MVDYLHLSSKIEGAIAIGDVGDLHERVFDREQATVIKGEDLLAYAGATE